MSYIGDYIKRRVHWAVWAILLLLFCGAALGLAFKAGHDRGPSEAEVIKGLKKDGWEPAERVKEIKDSLISEHLAAMIKQEAESSA
ncbi:MAG: hypothetical protein GY719_01670, partial [bacterium]|nr:hypothetical protein [bacterium]